MFVILGINHIRIKQLTFRRDFCLACAAPQPSVQVRIFLYIHFFWIPIFPLGFWKRWFCLKCRNRPHQNARTRRGFKIVGAVLLGLMATVAWTQPVDVDDAGISWGMRIMGPILCAVAVVWAFRHRPEPDLKQRLAALGLEKIGWCPICNQSLTETFGELICENCGIKEVSHFE